MRSDGRRSLQRCCAVGGAGHLVLELVDHPGPCDIKALDPGAAPGHLLVALVKPDAAPGVSSRRSWHPARMASSSCLGT
jgi:hypothetical protein